MEITRTNFGTNSLGIEKAIKNCDFIAIDTEFTGLDLPGEEVCGLFDSPAERYAKHTRSVRAFTLLQVGIGCFKRDAVMNKYEATVFNMYVFPASIGRYNAAFTSQCSSIEFLCRNGFDFNKSMHNGVPFLNRRDQASLQIDLESGMIGQNEIDIKYFADMCLLLNDWITKADVGQKLDLGGEPLGTGPQRWIFEYHLLRTFRRIRIQRSDHVKLTIELCSRVGDDSPENAQQLQNLLDKITKEFTGCAVLFDMLVETRKPIIGQNLLLDLMFFYEKFYEPLPDSYDAFKSQLRVLLPEIYDTKQIVSGMRKPLEDRGCKSFSVSGLYTFFETKSSTKPMVLYQPYVELGQDCQKYKTDLCPHEAGFDAYAVGVVFIRLAHTLAMTSITYPTPEPLEYSDHITAVKLFVNRVNLVNAAVSHMNLNGADPISLRPDWLLVSSKRQFQKLDRLRLVADLSNFGAFDLRPLSSSKALVAVAGHNTAQSMLEQLRISEDYSIRKYRNYYPKSQVGIKAALTAALVAIGALAAVWTFGALKGRGPGRS